MSSLKPDRRRISKAVQRVLHHSCQCLARAPPLQTASMGTRPYGGDRLSFGQRTDKQCRKSVQQSSTIRVKLHYMSLVTNHASYTCYAVLRVLSGFSCADRACFPCTSASRLVLDHRTRRNAGR